jgi:hypothetical protein
MPEKRKRRKTIVYYRRRRHREGQWTFLFPFRSILLLLLFFLTEYSKGVLFFCVIFVKRNRKSLYTY